LVIQITLDNALTHEQVISVMLHSSANISWITMLAAALSAIPL